MERLESNWEDHLTERKTENDLRDLLKTVVAFANSVKPGHVAHILIGETDQGGAQGVSNPDNIQKVVRTKCDEVYPPIVWRQQLYAKDGRTCIRVEIEYSGDTPHFGGPAWIRKGSESIKASAEMFQKLIDMRSAKVRELELRRGKPVTVVTDEHGKFSQTPLFTLNSMIEAEIQEVTKFWVTFSATKGTTRVRQSEPLEALILSWDDQKDRLKVILRYLR